MTSPRRKIIVIGAGIAGLCAAVHARKCGYDVEILEMHESAGGLATSWRRGDYTFETCLHWLYGSNPEGTMYALWREVLDIDKLNFVHSTEYLRLIPASGESLSIYTNVDRFEEELLAHAPEDAAEIRRLANAVRRFVGFQLPDLLGPRGLAGLLGALPYLPSVWQWLKISSAEYRNRFNNPLLKRFFGGGETGDLSALAFVLMLAWLSNKDAAYVVGGSQAIIRSMVKTLRDIGGQLRCGTAVEKILVEQDRAVGVRLAEGEIVKGDWVISAADGYATIFTLLGGRYRDKRIDRLYRTLKPFPSYLQVSLGVAADLSAQPGYATYLLDKPLALDPITRLEEISIRCFNFDPTFAPRGKTALTCMLPTRNVDYWTRLRREDANYYKVEKQRVADAVIAILERRIPAIRSAIEEVDVSSPATVVRYTGNWQGSMEGWLLTPKSTWRGPPQTLPGLGRFLMVGQWVAPGGGLPSGLLTARRAIQSVCSQDQVPFVTERTAQVRAAA